jgi:hypothetical protein
LFERHVLEPAPQVLRGKPPEVLADRVEDSAYQDQQLVVFPRRAVIEPGVDRHVAAVAEPILSDMVTEGLAVVFGVGVDRPVGLPAGVAHRRASTPSGGILALQPAVSFRALVVTELV